MSIPIVSSPAVDLKTQGRGTSAPLKKQREETKVAGKAEKTTDFFLLFLKSKNGSHQPADSKVPEDSQNNNPPNKSTQSVQRILPASVSGDANASNHEVGDPARSPNKGTRSMPTIPETPVSGAPTVVYSRTEVSASRDSVNISDAPKPVGPVEIDTSDDSIRKTLDICRAVMKRLKGAEYPTDGSNNREWYEREKKG